MPHEDVVKHRTDSFTYTDIQIAATNKVITLFTLPSDKCEIIGIYIDVDTAFSGVTTVEAMIGTTTSPCTEYLTNQSIKTTGIKSIKGTEPASRFLVPLSGGPIYLRVTGSSNLSGLTQGALTVRTCYVYHDY